MDEWILLILVLVPEAIAFYYIHKLIMSDEITSVIGEILMLLVYVAGSCLCVALNYSGIF